MRPFFLSNDFHLQVKQISRSLVCNKHPTSLFSHSLLSSSRSHRQLQLASRNQIIISQREIVLQKPMHRMLQLLLRRRHAPLHVSDLLLQRLHRRLHVDRHRNALSVQPPRRIRRVHRQLHRHRQRSWMRRDELRLGNQPYKSTLPRGTTSHRR